MLPLGYEWSGALREPTDLAQPYPWRSRVCRKWRGLLVWSRKGPSRPGRFGCKYVNWRRRQGQSKVRCCSSIFLQYLTILWAWADYWKLLGSTWCSTAWDAHSPETPRAEWIQTENWNEISPDSRHMYRTRWGIPLSRLWPSDTATIRHAGYKTVTPHRS